MDGFAYALDADSGKLIWKHDLGAQVTTASALYGHDLYMGTRNRHLFRIDSASGEVLKDFPTKSQPWGHLLITGDSLLVLLGDEMLVSVDLVLTKIRWSAEAFKEWTSARPYVWRDLVLAGNHRELVAFRSADGTRAWSYQFPETVRGIGTSPDILYVGTLKGPIFAFAPNPQKE
jgi:outer membrane protein assembly factor BamB